MLMTYQLSLEISKKLEQIIIAQHRSYLEKNVTMPKNQQRKIEGALCNVPVNYEQNVTYCLVLQVIWCNSPQVEKRTSPLQTEFQVFWEFLAKEFLGILKNSQLCK